MPTRPDPAPPPDAASARRVLALDATSLGHRAYHSTRGEDDADRDGVVTAVLASMLATVWVHGPYDTVVATFDDAVNVRRELDPTYKAHRPPSPADLGRHLSLLREHLAAAGLPVVVAPGAEADDVLVAVADAAVARGGRCDVLSSDRDLTAVVGPRVRLLRPRQRFSDLAIEDEAAVLATYGIPPALYAEFAALRGDPSDGLIGAKGIGERTAARLLQDHGSLLAVLAAIPDLPPRIAASLREARDRVEWNLLLMAPLARLDADVAAPVAARTDPVGLVELVDRLGFPRAATRLRRALDGGPDGRDGPPHGREG
jgi:DNA polymerase I